VQQNGFFQSNWVGSAGMGPSVIPNPPTPPGRGKGSKTRLFSARSDGGTSSGRSGPDEATGRHTEGIPVRSEGTDNPDDDFVDDSVGNRGDRELNSLSVVDEELRVRGVLALRVVGE
jgi:hypothetical protein